MYAINADEVDGTTFGREVIPQHSSYDKFKHVHLVKVEHRPSGVVGECITTLTYLNESRKGLSRVVVPGTTRLTVY